MSESKMGGLSFKGKPPTKQVLFIKATQVHINLYNWLLQQKFGLDV